MGEGGRGNRGLVKADGELLCVFDGLCFCGFNEVATVEVDPSPEEAGGGTLKDDEFLGVSRNRLNGGLDRG